MYKPVLNLRETERAIKLIKDSFELNLANALGLERVSAPLFVPDGSGLNDDLNGTERPVSFDTLDGCERVSIVQSLAKWKRMALKRYGFERGTGLYTDMNAIRRDEYMDEIHSVYVDQWDWEKVISSDERTFETLKQTVQNIVLAVKQTEETLHGKYRGLTRSICGEPFFISSEELLQRYPGMSAKERENAVAREHGTVFISQIGGKLSNGEKHDSRAPDYDDWRLNGDILIWYEPLSIALEISSMGIRVDEAALKQQLEISGCTDRAELPFHKSLLSGELPLTIGGGIGQSRLCLLLLEKVHIGEVHASVWSARELELCAERGITLL